MFLELKNVNILNKITSLAIVFLAQSNVPLYNEALPGRASGIV